MKKNYLLAGAAALVLSLTSCATPEDPEPQQAQPKVAAEPAKAAGPVNDTCPIMGGTVDPEGEMSTFGDAQVGYCCPGCKPKWEAWSDAEKSAFIAEASK